MDEDEMDAYMQRIKDEDENEDDEDWVLDDEFTVRSGGGGRGEGPYRDAPDGTIVDLMTSLQEPHLPPSPDNEENKGWLFDIMQDDPRYGETHNVHMAMMHRMAHASGDSHSITFLDQLNKGYR